MEKFKLVEGTFNAEDSEEILLTLIEQKIKFHELKSFSNEVKTGNKHTESLNKVAELNETRAKIKQLLNSEANKYAEFNILSTINIEILHKNSGNNELTLDKNNIIN